MNVLHERRCHDINRRLRSHLLDNHVHASSEYWILAEEQLSYTEKQEISLLLSKSLTPIEVINEVLYDFGAFGRFNLTFVKASGFVQGLGFVYFHWVLLRVGPDLVEILLAGLDQTFHKVHVTLHFKSFKNIKYQVICLFGILILITRFGIFLFI